MDTKKISFGFSKVKKVEKVVKEEEKKDFIECLEDKSIKVFGGDVVKEYNPLIIPMMKNTKPSLEALARIAQEVESENVLAIAELKPKPSIKLEPKEGETLEERAAREIIEDLQNVKTEDNKVYSLPIAQSNQVEGKEATIEEYENIPITEFGLAMLRGMGWAPGKGVGKKETKVPVSQPQPRPKGLGLGADRVVQPPSDTKNKNTKEQIEELKMVKGACVKICNGSNAGSFGQIIGFDEDSGRIIVELAVKKTAINISEFMVQLVSKQEYQDQSRIINSLKVEEYKIKENGSKFNQSTSSKIGSKHSNKSRDDSSEASVKSRKECYSKNQREHNDQHDNKNQKRDQNDYEDHLHQRHQHDHEHQRVQREYEDGRYYNDKCDQKDPRDLNEEKSSISKSSSKIYASHNSSEEDKTRNTRNRERRKDPTDSNSDSTSRHRSRKKDERKNALRNSSSSPELRRKDKDKDKKRKGKKKRRDRSRSPNYRKYKK